MDKQKLTQWYEKLDYLEQSGIVGNAYGGTPSIETDAVWEIVDMFYEFIAEEYEELPDWANAFVQIYSWQFQNFHEGLTTYYENFYEYTDYDSIMSTREFLTKEGYEKLAQCYNYVLFEEDTYSLDEIRESFQKTCKWIGDNEQIIQDFYIDVLKKHRGQLEKLSD